MQKYIYLLLCLFVGTLATGQVQDVQFGKNRVQYHRDFDEWSEYESENFITYWYGQSRQIGQAVVMMAEADFRQIQRVLEHRLNDKIQIIVYTDVTDLKQNNIGTEEAFTNTGGQTRIVANKVFVYFDGDHNDLRRQVREGIASVYLEAMLFGTNLQEIVQNAVMMNLPQWFKDGLVNYVGETWNTKLDNQLRDIMLNEKEVDFVKLAQRYPALMGHSLWYFISESYGQSTVSNLLYLTRINRSVESGFMYVLGSPYEIVVNNWAKFFQQRYKLEEQMREKPAGKEITFRNKRKLPVTQAKLSPDGRKIVYVTNEIGKYRVYLQDVRSGDRKVIHKGGFRNPFQTTDYGYPLLAWNPNNREVAIMHERRDLVKLMTYDTETGKKEVSELAPEYQRVYSMAYTSPIALVYSAAYRGQSDIFMYYLKTRQTERITNDIYDDLDAAHVTLGGKQGIVFASNRPDTMLTTVRLDTILPLGTFDLFFFDLENRSKELIRITNTPYTDERSPMPMNEQYLAYTSDQSGVRNREAAYIEEYIAYYNQAIVLKDGTEILLHADSSLTTLDTTLIDTIYILPVNKWRGVGHPVSNYSRSILEQSVAPRVSKTAELVLYEGQYRVFLSDMLIDTLITPPLTNYQGYRLRSIKKQLTAAEEAKMPAAPKETVLPEVKKEPAKQDTVPAPPPKEREKKIDIDNYMFQSEFDDEPRTKPAPKPQTPPATATPPSTTAPEQGINIVTIRPQERRARSLRPLADNQEAPVHLFRPGLITPYRLQFRTDYVTTQLDNSLLFEGLESYAGNPGGFNYPPAGILAKTNFKDLFEDYEIEAGVRIPTSFNGSEYFLLYNNKKRRLDQQFALYRRNMRYPDNEGAPTLIPRRREVNTLLAQYGVRYPLDIFRSLRATATIRRDRSTFLATELPALQQPVLREPRMGIKVEYVFDNTLDAAVNIKNGTRYKLYAEAIKRFNVDVETGLKLSFGEGFMGVLGFDARHYQRLDKRSILAFRAAGATSFGSEKILYFLGGTTNWLFNSFNDDIPVAQDENYAYQALAASMRGFRVNIRNGNSYVLTNTELRVPIFRYFSNNIRQAFFRDFQVVGFFDVGTAWTGLSPLSDENPLNTSTFPNNVPNPVVSIKVRYFRDPIVAGYGFGVRTTLFGYFVRLDYAYGIETRKVQPGRLFLSLGMDF